jgi:hypothetical protein
MDGYFDEKVCFFRSVQSSSVLIFPQGHYREDYDDKFKEAWYENWEGVKTEKGDDEGGSNEPDVTIVLLLRAHR